MSRAFSVLEVVLTKMLEPLVSPHKRTLVHPDIRCKVLAENHPEPGASCRGNFKPRPSDMFLVLWLAGLVVVTATGAGGVSLIHVSFVRLCEKVFACHKRSVTRADR